jgi:hypothetical protein
MASVLAAHGMMPLPEEGGSMYRARQALAVVAWALLVALIVQVYFAGMGLFGVSNMDLHINTGHSLTLLPIIMLVLAWPARPGRTVVVLTVALLVLVFVQTALPFARDDMPAIAALHAPMALVIFGLSLLVARRATLLLRTEQVVPLEADAAETLPAEEVTQTEA